MVIRDQITLNCERWDLLQEEIMLFQRKHSLRDEEISIEIEKEEWHDYCSAKLVLKYNREETSEEEQSRLDKEKQLKEWREQAERRQYEALQKKYGN